MPNFGLPLRGLKFVWLGNGHAFFYCGFCAEILIDWKIEVKY